MITSLILFITHDASLRNPPLPHSIASKEPILNCKPNNKSKSRNALVELHTTTLVHFCFLTSYLFPCSCSKEVILINFSIMPPKEFFISQPLIRDMFCLNFGVKLLEMTTPLPPLHSTCLVEQQHTPLHFEQSQDNVCQLHLLHQFRDLSKIDLNLILSVKIYFKFNQMQSN